MGWETSLFCNISFNKKTYNSRYDVEEDLKEIEGYIDTCKRTLHNLGVMTEPEKFYDKERYDSPLDYIDDVFKDNIELLEEYLVEKYKLEQLLWNWDKCHNSEGLAIDPPDGIEWDSAFLKGDFVYSEKYPNKNALLQ